MLLVIRPVANHRPGVHGGQDRDCGRGIQQNVSKHLTAPSGVGLIARSRRSVPQKLDIELNLEILTPGFWDSRGNDRTIAAPIGDSKAFDSRLTAASEERNMRVFLSIAVGMALIGFVISGCGGDDSSTSAESSSSEGASTTEEGNSGSSGEKYSIGIVQFAAADETSSLALKGFEKAADELGYELSSIDPQGETDKAVGAMQTLVQKGVDMIAVAVFPSTSLTAGVVAAKEAGIPVVSLSGGTTDGVQVNYDAGKPSGELLAEYMMEQTGGKGSLLALGYKLGLPCIGREEALDEAIAGSELADNETREEVPIPGQVAASTQFTQAFLAKHPSQSEELTIWGCFDDPALGAIAATKEANRTGVGIYGINGQPAAVKAIKNGEMTATVWLDVTKAGEEMAENTPKYVEAGVDAPPTDIPIPDELVNKDNVDQFIADHPEVLAAE